MMPFVIQKKHLDKDSRKALKKKTLRKKKLVVFISVTTVLLMLLSTKYFNFFGSIINEVCSAAGLSAPIPVMEMLMPLGISYYTLMAVSYIVDCYRGTARPEKNLLMLLLYLCYFPHIVEGPFDRFDNLSKQFRKPHRFDYGQNKERWDTLSLGSVQEDRHCRQGSSHRKYGIFRYRSI